ncbi:hypothetical protein KR200_011331 [Drosophila serrata]|nr:hypothetical protein KR200_011331 [Drosophila serrata]
MQHYHHNLQQCDQYNHHDDEQDLPNAMAIRADLPAGASHTAQKPSGRQQLDQICANMQQQEIHRARSIWERSLDNKHHDVFERWMEWQPERQAWQTSARQELFKAYIIHEKKYGNRAGIEDVIVSKRKYQYEEVAENRLPALHRGGERARPDPRDLEAEDAERTRQIHKACLELMPHMQFTFSKLWLLYAQFKISYKELKRTQKALAWPSAGLQSFGSNQIILRSQTDGTWGMFIQKPATQTLQTQQNPALQRPGAPILPHNGSQVRPARSVSTQTTQNQCLMKGKSRGHRAAATAGDSESPASGQLGGQQQQQQQQWEQQQNIIQQIVVSGGRTPQQQQQNTGQLQVTSVPFTVSSTTTPAGIATSVPCRRLSPPPVRAATTPTSKQSNTGSSGTTSSTTTTPSGKEKTKMASSINSSAATTPTTTKTVFNGIGTGRSTACTTGSTTATTTTCSTTTTTCSSATSTTTTTTSRICPTRWPYVPTYVADRWLIFKYRYTSITIAQNQKVFERWMEWQPERQAWQTSARQELFKAYIIHEKKYGNRAGIEDVIVSKRKYQYEEVAENRLPALHRGGERARPDPRDLEAEDAERTRQIHKACLELMPHMQFTFSKLWLLYAQFKISYKELKRTQKALAWPSAGLQSFGSNQIILRSQTDGTWGMFIQKPATQTLQTQQNPALQRPGAPILPHNGTQVRPASSVSTQTAQNQSLLKGKMRTKQQPVRPALSALKTENGQFIVGSRGHRAAATAGDSESPASELLITTAMAVASQQQQKQQGPPSLTATTPSPTTNPILAMTSMMNATVGHLSSAPPVTVSVTSTAVTPSPGQLMTLSSASTPTKETPSKTATLVHSHLRTEARRRNPKQQPIKAKPTSSSGTTTTPSGKEETKVASSINSSAATTPTTTKTVSNGIGTGRSTACTTGSTTVTTTTCSTTTTTCSSATSTTTTTTSSSNGAKDLPKAMIKPNVLTHVIDGFIIQKANEPFSVTRQRYADKDVADEPPKKKAAMQEDMKPSGIASAPASDMVACEQCGILEHKTKLNWKRFCSPGCARQAKNGIGVGGVETGETKSLGTGGIFGVDAMALVDNLDEAMAEEKMQTDAPHSLSDALPILTAPPDEAISKEKMQTDALQALSEPLLEFADLLAAPTKVQVGNYGCLHRSSSYFG